MLYRLRVIACVTLFFASAASFAQEPKWLKVQSQHYTVITDGPEKRAREIALRFEEMRGVFAQILLKDRLNMPVPLQIIAFKNTDELKQFAPTWKSKPVISGGLFQSGEDRNFVVLDLSADNNWPPVYHEYAHMLLNPNYPRTQPWFDEGLAEYFSTVKLDKGIATVGAPPDYASAALKGKWYPLEQLFSVAPGSPEVNDGGDRRSIFYAQSWLVFHYISQTHKMKELTRYFDLVMNRHVAVAEAITQAFGVAPDQMDRDLHEYFTTNRMAIAQNPAPGGVEENTFVPNKIKDYEAETAIADVHAHAQEYQTRAITEFQNILKREPTSADAELGIGYVYLTRGDLDQATRHLKRAEDMESTDDFRVHYFYALCLQKKWMRGGQDPEVLVEINQSTEKALTTVANFPDLYNVKAFALSHARDHEQAAVLLRKAIALAPRNDSYKLSLAQELAAVKKYDDALSILGQLKYSPDAQIAKVAAEQTQTIAQWKDKPILQILADQREVEAPQWRKKNASGDKEELEVLEQAQSGQATPKDMRPTKYLKGTLTSVECASPRATLNVTSGARKYRFLIPDISHAVLIGTDEFSCAWKNRHVSVNYRESSGGGDVVSLEVE